MDAISFLKTVRYEARRLPDVNVSNINPRDFDSKRTSKLKRHKRQYVISPLEYIPNIKWKQQHVKRFNLLREVCINYYYW